MTSEAVASCSGDAFWTPGPHLCLQPPLCHSPALSSSLPVGLLILRVGRVISTPGIVGTSPTMVCRVAGSRSHGVWLYSSESALCVLPTARPCPARTLSTVSSVLACELLSKWGRLALKCLTEMGGRVSGCQWHERAVQQPLSLLSPWIRPRPLQAPHPPPTLACPSY